MPDATQTLGRMFAGLTEHAFLSRLGVADPPLIDYLSGLLARFVRLDNVFTLRGGRGERLTELARMVAEADALPEGGRTRCEYHRQIGDVALFWSGLFPEAIERDVAAWGSHAVVNYTLFGKRSYLTASRYEDEARHRQEAAVLRRLSEQFELCATGLREVRRDWESLPGGGAGLVIP